MEALKTDKDGYNDLYKDTVSKLISSPSKEDYIERFGRSELFPFCKGGSTKGYVRGLVVKALFHGVESRGLSPKEVHILDAGCGQGELSVYLAAYGFQVVGVDISEEAKQASTHLASAVGVRQNCCFLAESLEKISLPDRSVDFVIGHACIASLYQI